VDARYARAAPEIGTRSVRERVFREALEYLIEGWNALATSDEARKKIEAKSRSV
jgi:hypothetical protein